MILSHQKKFLFIHIYKVAGTSIRRVLDRYDDRTWNDFPFLTNVKFKIGSRSKRFSTWAIDHITASQCKDWLSPEVFNQYFKFSFVRNPWDWQVSLYHFMLQDKHHRQHKLISKTKNFEEYLTWRVNKDIELQTDFLYDKSGTLLVDYIGRFETLQSDFNEICRRLNIQSTQLPITNRSHHQYYKEYYNDRTRDMVANAFKKDIELLGYEF